MAGAGSARIAVARPPQTRSAYLRLAPLGVPLDVELVGSDDLAGLAEVWRHWRGEPEASDLRLSLRIKVGGDTADLNAPEVTIAGSVLRLRGQGIDAVADSNTREAACTIARSHLQNAAWLSAEVLETLVLYLLARSDRTPVHASSFLAGDLAILLAGPSGSGKSSLALAADAAGLEVLGEDTAFVQVRPHLRVWGWRGPVHLLPADVAGAQDLSVRVRNGNAKFAVPLRTREGAVSVSRAVFCLLERGDAVALDRLSPEQATGGLGPFEPGFDLMAEAIGEARSVLTRKGAWRLTLSRDPSEAIGLLLANLDRLRGTAVP